jgi:hypothetical protein
LAKFRSHHVFVIGCSIEPKPITRMLKKSAFIVCTQFWLYVLMVDYHFGYIKNLKKKKKIADSAQHISTIKLHAISL